MRIRLALLATALLAAAVTLPLAAQPLTVKCGTLLDPATRTAKANVEIFFEGGKVKGLGSSGASAAKRDVPLFTF